MLPLPKKKLIPTKLNHKVARPISATIAAALKKVAKETIPTTELIVGILTGHGLKNPPKV